MFELLLECRKTTGDVNVMQLKKQVAEIVETMTQLPPDKVEELQDFARFLKERYAQAPAANNSLDWTEDELKSLSQSVWQHAEEAMPWDGKPGE
jgi:hypothetical protein